MADKPKIALYWCASCGGCEETIIDIDEAILDVVAAVDIVFWPVAMDFKYSDIESMKDGEIAVCFINGAVRTSEQEHVAHLLRKKSNVVIAFGSCAVSGGIPALANLKNKKEIFDSSYISGITVDNDEKTVPKTESTVDNYKLTLPEFYETVYQLSDIIEVDYYLPGCPPTAKMVVDAVNAILTNNLPPVGSNLLPDKSLCTSCDRNDSKPDNLTVEEYKRPHEIIADPEICLLTQGLVCMGPSTRDGCDYPCVKGNMPCTGCNGPISDADQGAKMIGALGGACSSDEDNIDNALKGIPDPAGTFYRYSLSSSLLGSQNAKKDKEK